MTWNDVEEGELIYSSDSEPGFRRRKTRDGFSYQDSDGKPLKDPHALARIKSLAIPPAWTDVWISPNRDGHLQATGRDARGRKQYRYNTRWREVRDAAKFQHTMAFAKALPALRERVDADMRRPGVPREKVLATVVRLLELTLIRVGNEEYAKANNSFGLTTLRNRHLALEGNAMKFEFKGKSGKHHSVRLRDRRLARIVRQISEIKGQQLFQYLDEDGQRRQVTSGDVNDYLREATGGDFTAKDFRTWTATVLAAVALRDFEPAASQAELKRNLNQAIERVAEALRNTPAICRKCYVHPDIVESYLEGHIPGSLESRVQGLAEPNEYALSVEEQSVVRLLRAAARRRKIAAGHE